MYYNITFSLASMMMAVVFLVIGIVFLLGKEKATIFISGFNFKSKEERVRYDRGKMSRDMRNRCFIYTAIYLAGGILTYMIGAFFFAVTVVAWLVIFLSQVHLDPDKAFRKYKLQQDDGNK